MHFAYPPRKDSAPPRFVPRSTQFSTLRRRRLKVVAIIGLAIITFLYLISRGSSGQGPPREHVPSGKPPAVIVTVLDESDFRRPYLETVKENRRQYAERHGYAVMFPKIGEYDLKGSPFSWTKVVAMRDAMTKFPDAKFIWFLDQDYFIMNAQATIEEDVMKPTRLESLMIKDHPVVPPDSIIKTFAHLKGQDIDFVLTQDVEGLSVNSFVIRNGEWARFFLEVWFDPIYRTYNFQKAETHALEHIVQWHPTILSRLALIPQNVINAGSTSEKGAQYQPGDMVVRLSNCAKASNTKPCETELEKFTQLWRTAFSGS
ncbi:hypothetical protein VTK73DRAFT_22 [Phialemonium thermophilum]|uniref:Uncharacterized protein n=1 Tax=Phialemonium thermophilum TaxID=223376 RepID=A0ABR3Y8D9_9PEZI